MSEGTIRKCGRLAKSRFSAGTKPAQKTALGLLEVDHDLPPEIGKGDLSLVDWSANGMTTTTNTPRYLSNGPVKIAERNFFIAICVLVLLSHRHFLCFYWGRR